LANLSSSERNDRLGSHQALACLTLAEDPVCGQQRSKPLICMQPSATPDKLKASYVLSNPCTVRPARRHSRRAFVRSRAFGMQATVVTLEHRGASKGFQHGRVFHTKERLNKSPLRLRHTAYCFPNPRSQQRNWSFSTAQLVALNSGAGQPAVFRPLTQGAIAAPDLFRGSQTEDEQ